MVPQPVWLERPVVELCDPKVKLDGPKPDPLPFLRNTSGKRTPTSRYSTSSPSSVDLTWHERPLSVMALVLSGPYG